MVVVVVVVVVSHNLMPESSSATAMARASATAIAGAMISPTSTRRILFRPPTPMFGNVVINNRYKPCRHLFFPRAVKIMKKIYWHYVFGMRR